MDKDVLQIEIPEGYELDKENSTSFNVKFKKKEENEEPKGIIQHCLMEYRLLTFHTSKQAEDFLVNNRQLEYDYLMLDLKE